MPHRFHELDGWFDFSDIYELAIRRSSATRDPTFVEVGCYLGKSTCYMAEALIERACSATLHIVDTFCGDQNIGAANFHAQFVQNMIGTGVWDRLNEVHVADSVRFAESMPLDSVDFVFIDAEHTFESVARDLAAWWPRVRAGGLMAGHDYTDWFPGLRGAVDEFVRRHDLAKAFRATGSSWMVYKSLSIDAAYCINLPNRTDRRTAAKAEFARAGIEVAMHQATRGSDLPPNPTQGSLSDGQRGCIASHVDVHRRARADGARRVLVFEDDIELEPGFDERLRAAFSRCPTDFDLFYPGAICVRNWGGRLFPFDDLVARVHSVLGTHSYVIDVERHDFSDRLPNQPEPIDRWFDRELHSRHASYIAVPYLARQHRGISDIAQCENDNGQYQNYVY